VSMHRLPFFAALALVLAATQTMACQNAACAIGDSLAPVECNTIGCVRPTNALEKLTKTAERSLSVMRATKLPTTLGLCRTGDCLTDPTATPLPKKCSSAGCARPEPKAPAGGTTSNEDASTGASALVTDAFAAMRVPASTWAERWGVGAALPTVRTNAHAMCLSSMLVGTVRSTFNSDRKLSQNGPPLSAACYSSKEAVGYSVLAGISRS
jgi:hypothetical protein